MMRLITKMMIIIYDDYDDDDDDDDDCIVTCEENRHVLFCLHRKIHMIRLVNWQDTI